MASSRQYAGWRSLCPPSSNGCWLARRGWLRRDWREKAGTIHPALSRLACSEPLRRLLRSPPPPPVHRETHPQSKTTARGATARRRTGRHWAGPASEWQKTSKQHSAPRCGPNSFLLAPLPPVPPPPLVRPARTTRGSRLPPLRKNWCAVARSPASGLSLRQKPPAGRRPPAYAPETPT